MHTCRNTVIGCMDFRIQKTLTKLLEHLNIEEGSFDRLAFAAGAANTYQLMFHLGLSKKLHASCVAVLSVHEGCGAAAVKDDLFSAANTARSTWFVPKLFFVKL